MRGTAFLSACLCMGFILMIPCWAMAKSKEDGEREKAAKKACLLGQVGKGTEILADLYVETNDPTYVYNQGRCFEQNGRDDEAVLRFKKYARKATGLSPEDVEALHKKIAELEAAIAHRKSEPATAVPPLLPSVVPSASGASGTGAQVGDPLGVTPPGLPPRPQTTPPVYKRWWFWTGVGVLVAGGVTTAVLLSRRSAPASPPCDGSAPCVP